MKTVLTSLLLVVCAHAYGHNTGGSAGVSGAAGGMRNGVGSALGHSSAATGNTGQGSRYSLSDEYQPWPQSEMQQYAKPKFEPYKGK